MTAETQALEKLLDALLEEHHQLLACLGRKREAIAHARLDEVGNIVTEEQAIIKRVSELERHRLALVRRMTRAIDPNARDAMSLSDITQAIDDDSQRATLMERAEKLREEVHEVRRQSSIVRAAAEALSRHMSGVMKSVQSALSRAGIYSNNGHLATGAQLDFNVDVKS